ncbi:hypothetical protein GIB67_008351 [Kingdonia uniflora]|uniref:DUF4378 domain-containing protein n=1 Tax=Kingdonia uniflora TaxID=39325 RepID=A0A7J7N5A7_9MAGN|nr:hypothetical protein GIB67_008351 [Kingdonia uniflora]
MAKKAWKRLGHCEKNASGCMWSLTKILEFRKSRSTRKLLLDKTHASDAGDARERLKLLYQKSPDIEGDGRIVGKNNVSTTCVEKLMEEEMLSATILKNPASSATLGQKRPNQEYRNTNFKNPEQTNIHHENEEDSCYLQRHISSMKHSHLDGLDSSAVLKHLIQENPVQATEAFLSNKSINVNRVTEDEAFHQSKQFKEALELFNSDKELFLKLLKAPNSSLSAEIDNLRRREKLVFQKSRDKNSIMGSQNLEVSRRIIDMEPISMQKYNTSSFKSLSSSSQPHYSLKSLGRRRRTRLKFAFAEMKRKLKDTLAHKAPYKRGDGWKCCKGKIAERKLRSKNSFKVERTDIACVSVDSRENSATETLGSLKQEESRMCAQAKKQLAEMLRIKDEDETSLNHEVPRSVRRTLGRLLSSLEYNFSPIQSPVKNKDNSFVTQIHDDLRVSREGGEINEVLNSSPVTPKGFSLGAKINEWKCFTIGESSSKGGVGIVEPTDIGCLDDKSFDVPLKPVLITPTTSSNGSTDSTHFCMEEDISKCSTQDSLIINEELASSLESLSSNSLHNKEVKDVAEGPEQPSPVSVLDPFCLEDASTESRPNEPQIQPVALNFEEHHSYTPNKETYLTSFEEDQTFSFDQCFISEVELMLTNHHSCYDRKVLSDCMNEVIVEVHNRYFGCSPWVSFVKPSMQGLPGKITYDIRNGVNRCMGPHPGILDKIVENDMAQCKTWMDLRSNTEYVSNEMVDIILEELMEETVLCCQLEEWSSGY